MTSHKKQTIPDKTRKRVFERDNYTCRYCGSKKGPFHTDHVYPESKGGETTLNNLVTACGHCNQGKGAHVGIWPKPIGHFGRVERANALIAENERMLSEQTREFSAKLEAQNKNQVSLLTYINAALVVISLVLVFAVRDSVVTASVIFLNLLVKIVLADISARKQK